MYEHVNSNSKCWKLLSNVLRKLLFVFLDDAPKASGLLDN